MVDLQPLTDAFNNASLCHVSIDFQDFYCAVDHERNRNPDTIQNHKARHFKRIADKAKSFGAYLEKLRVPQFWFAQNIGMSLQGRKIYDAANPEKPEDMFEKTGSLPSGKNIEVLLKREFNAFQDTKLDEKLKSKNAKVLLISGLELGFCVKETVEDALSRGYRIYMVEDLICHWPDGESEFKQYARQNYDDRVCFVSSNDVKRALKPAA